MLELEAFFLLKRNEIRFESREVMAWRLFNFSKDWICEQALPKFIIKIGPVTRPITLSEPVGLLLKTYTITWEQVWGHPVVGIVCLRIFGSYWDENFAHNVRNFEFGWNHTEVYFIIIANTHVIGDHTKMFLAHHLFGTPSTI